MIRADTQGMVPRRVFELFYLATPAFAAMDLALGVPARAAGIPSAGWRLAYYAMLMGCWWVCRFWPRGAPVVGLCESSVNLLLLLLSILLPVWSVGDQFVATGSTELVFGVGVWWNVAISGPMLILSIKSNEKALLNRWIPSQ